MKPWSHLVAGITLLGLVSACYQNPAAGGSGGPQICDQYNAPTPPPGYDENGCWEPAEYFERAPEVIPSVAPSDPLLRIEATGQAPMGIEGTLFFVRAMSPTARIVLEREWMWPSLDQQIPPGAYQVTAFARTCDANCDYLDPTIISCTIDVVAEPSFTYTMSYDVQSDGSIKCSLNQ